MQEIKKINLSLEWNEVKLEDVGKIITGKTPKTSIEDNYGGHIPFLTPSDDMNVKIIKYTNKTLTLKGLNEVKNCLIPKNSVCVSCIGSDLGKVVLTSEDTVTNQQINSIIVNEMFDYNFIYYTMILLGKQLNYMSKSSTAVPIINKSTFSNELIFVPSLEEQKKISSILSNIDAKIDNLDKINKNLEEQLSLIFEDIFVKCSPYEKESLVKTDFGYLPNGWKNIDFGELIQITSGDRPDEKSEVKTSEFNIPLFGASKIMGYTKESSYNEEILIIGRVGTHGVIQRVNYPCFPSDNTFVIKSEYYGFVYQLLKRIDYDSLNTGSTQPLITQKSLKTVKVIFPDETTLFKFEKISKVFFDKIHINNNEIKSLTKLRDTLLPNLMSSEIDVSKINCDLKIIIRKIYIKSSKLFLWRYLSENQNYIKNTKSNETLLKSRTIHKINKFLAKFNARYRYYRQ